MLNAHETETQVCAALEKSGDADRLKLVEVMADIATVVLRCEEHGNFMLSTYALLGRLDGSRPGKRCPACEEQPRWKAATFEEVVARAARHGYAPEFREEDYTDTQGVLRWRCLKHADHKKACRIGVLGHRQCPTCMEEAKKRRLMERLKRWARKVGDTILSPEEQCTGPEARIDFRCGNCGKVLQMRADGILNGKGHACRARKRRRLAMQAKHAVLKREAEQFGITIMTPAHLYTGTQGYVRIKESVSARSRFVKYETLARMLTERAAERDARGRKKRATRSATWKKGSAGGQEARIGG